MSITYNFYAFDPKRYAEISSALNLVREPSELGPLSSRFGKPLSAYYLAAIERGFREGDAGGFLNEVLRDLCAEKRWDLGKSLSDFQLMLDGLDDFEPLTTMLTSLMANTVDVPFPANLVPKDGYGIAEIWSSDALRNCQRTLGRYGDPQTYVTLIERFNGLHRHWHKGTFQGWPPNHNWDQWLLVRQSIDFVVDGKRLLALGVH